MRRRSYATETCRLQRLQPSQGEIQRIGRVGEVLDRLVTAGATDIANIEYDFGASRDSAYDRGARWNLFPCLAVDARHANGESRGHSVREHAPDSHPA